MKQGKIRFVNFEKKFGFIETSQGESIHFRLIVVQKPTRWEDLVAGMEVSFETTRGEKGPTATWVRVIGQTATQTNTQPETHTQPAAQNGDWPPPRGYHFLNPYNFVRFLEGSSSIAEDETAKRMGKCAPPAHDRWEGLSGKIQCRLTAVTPLFISQGTSENPGEKHPEYRFVRKGDDKYIPGSSLRGPVRSVFEAVTNSCFATLAGEKRLSYRLDPKLAGFLVPARLEMINDQWKLRLLTGSAELSVQEKPRELYPASVRRYKPLRSSSKNPHAKPPKEVDLSPLLEPQETYKQDSQFHRRVCHAVLMRLQFPPSWRVIAVAKTKMEADQWITAHRSEFQSDTKLRSVNGVLCITNQNIDNKASERFFFQGDRPIVINLGNKGEMPQLIRNYQDLLQDYYDLHKREVETFRKEHPGAEPHKPYKDQAGFSRFMLEDPGANDWAEKRNGEVLYAYLENNNQGQPIPRYLAPVSIPRVAYDHTIGDLLPREMHRCEEGDQLCPACRTFGWVRASQGGASQAYRGRVRFSDGQHEVKKPYPQALTLAILGSPKPTTTRFYLTAPDGHPRSGQSDHTIGYDGNGGKNCLRGRKFYRHHLPNPRFLEAEPDKKTGERKSNQNRTILAGEAEDAGAQFTFTVTYENLAPEELGALLWSLEVGERGFHRMGFGKPLGLGSVEVKIEKIESMDAWQRYSSLDARGGWTDVTGKKTEWLQAFQEAMARRYAPREATQAARNETPDWERVFLNLPNLVDLLAIVGKQEPKLPVHYPRSSAPPKETNGSFEWFMGNKRRERLELDLPAVDKGLPLINKQGEVW